MFLAKAFTLLLALAAFLGVIAAFARKSRLSDRGRLEVRDFNARVEDLGDTLDLALASPKARKSIKRARRRSRKQEQPSDDGRRRIFVLDFHGDLRASAVDRLREEITAALLRARSGDEIVVRLESGGGMVHAYGLAASQLDRIVKAGIPLSVCVDKVAASGGYMMACVAGNILAAPFAVLGSIGVMAQIPNVHRLLKRHDIDVELLTAGEYKRTLTVLGENAPAGREKFQRDLDATHQLFKDHVAAHRPQLDIKTIATGEVWFGTQALALGLVDKLATSDEYLNAQLATADIYELSYVTDKTLLERLGMTVEMRLAQRLRSWWDGAREPQLPV
ncbi:MAG: protease SohB [Porticoccaceae bacterium]|nr:MAG: protease SohB [Porticoccaceae bacterium]